MSTETVIPPSADTPCLATIALSGDIRHDSPVAWMVFCHRDLDHEYMVFTERQSAECYADEQAELANSKHWPVYALWGADIGAKPNAERSGAGRSSSPSPCSAIDVAHEWLKKSRQEWNGHISTWTLEQMDSYHRDLGLLVDFVTDCWPNAKLTDAAGEKL